MYKISEHPILDIPADDLVEFRFNGQTVRGQRGKTIAAALHQAGFPVHSHSLDGRPRSLECGIGKCGACEMLVDGQVRRICITLVDGVHEVKELTPDWQPGQTTAAPQAEVKMYRTRVAIVGGGPAGLACREQLNRLGIPNLVIDNNGSVGGQFTMQTHQFFFFEQEKCFGGMRGFDIARQLTGDNTEGILLNEVVWDVLEGRRLALKNLLTDAVSYIDADCLVVATGAVPFMPAFENDDVPGVYTAAVFQKMMNREHTLLGRKVLTVGAGNIGYLTSYQAMQAGATVRAILEGMDHEGGFPVQANRVRRLGIPILTSHVLLKAIPNADRSGITGAVVAQCRNFQPIAGTEKTIDDIDAINICTGLIPDSQLLAKGKEVFGGDRVWGCGDAVRIGEGTSAVLRGRQAAYEVAQALGIRYNYDEYLDVSRQYIDSQQRPVRVLDQPRMPSAERAEAKPFVVADCLYGFACNPCTFSCPQQAISKAGTSSVPLIDYDKCIGCMQCVTQCPGLALFGYDRRRDTVFLPVEFDVTEGSEVWLVDNQGARLCDGRLEKLLRKPNKTHLARIKVQPENLAQGRELTDIRGFIVKDRYPEPLPEKPVEECPGKTYVCHCEDISLETLMAVVGSRKFISVDELKHTTRIGMGPCRGKRCLPRVRQLLRSQGVELTGEATPRAPLSAPVTLGNVWQAGQKETLVFQGGEAPRRERLAVLVAGGGMAGSAAFRYFAEAGLKPVLVNYDHGSSWRCIGGGRPAFSNPDISDIARHNLEIFRQDQAACNIDLKMTRYVNLVHDEATYRALDASRAWSDAYMISRKDFAREISPYWNPDEHSYSDALISNDCWQATPGRTIAYVRSVGESKGGRVLENCELIRVSRNPDGTVGALVRRHDGGYTEFVCDHFVNALGPGAEKFTDSLGLDTRLYPVKHQAFITRRLPNLGKNGDSLDMIIDRRHFRGFSAVYGQQFAHTGQIIGCASPDCDAYEARQNLKFNSREFLQAVSEMFAQWIPSLADVSIQATWAGYYMEPRYLVDPEAGLLTGLRGHGFMLGQYLAKLYVDSYLGRPVPSYMKDLALTGQGLQENAFK